MIYFFLGIYLKFIPFNNLEKKIPDHFAKRHHAREGNNKQCCH